MDFDMRGGVSRRGVTDGDAVAADRSDHGDRSASSRSGRDAEVEFIELALHDLKGAVAVLEASMDLMKSSMTRLRAHEVSAMRDARLAARRVQRYVDHVVSARRWSHGMPTQRRERVRVARIVEELTCEYAGYGREWGVALSVDIRGGVTDELLGDATLITRVLQNLIENALTHNRIGGRAHVRVDERPGSIEVHVCSDGRAIPPARRERVFDKYVGESDARSSGLGLYFARMVAEGHGGTLRLAPDPGWPVCFVLQLPTEASQTKSGARR